MKRKSSRRRSTTHALPPEVGSLLEEIEKEPVPERLLELAMRLQEALAKRRGEEEEAEEAPRRAKRAGHS